MNNNTICNLLLNWFSSHSMMFSKFTHVIACISTPFLLPNISLYMNIQHFVYHPSADGYFDCFPLLVVMNVFVLQHSSTSFWVDIHFISLGFIPRLEISGSYSNYMFNFWGTDRLFSKVTENGFTFLLAVMRLQSLHAFTTLVIVWIFHYSHLVRYRMVSHWFLVYFHND